jgi:Domain of unknown function (DUF3854)/Domain of unknown function (DUF927)
MSGLSLCDAEGKFTTWIPGRTDRADKAEEGASMSPTTATAPTPRLLQPHREELEAVKLQDETISANGIYSEDDPKAVAKLIHWSVARAKLLGPVLVYPHYDRDGNSLDHVTIKPDNPRDRAEKPGKIKQKEKPEKIKYENPRGKPNRVYIPAAARDAITNPTGVLIITEGCKKALAATQNGLPCVSIPGVWCWCAQREKRNGRKVGNLTLNPDLAAIAWEGRLVYIVYDSDAATNPDVARAERALAAVLTKAGAMVKVVRLPPDGSKNGIDDFLARHTVDAFRTIIETAAPTTEPGEVPVDPSQFTESGYTANQGSTYHCILVRDKDSGELRIEKKTKLCNFTAQIVGETINDDGAEQTREFAVSLEKRGKSAVTGCVPIERFGSLDWVVENFGPGYIIQAGNGKRDHLRCAIQEMSGEEIPSTTVYSHTGWRQIGGHWCYLHGDGATVPSISARQTIEVRLDGAAAGFRLPHPATGDTLRTAVRASLGILDGLVPDPVGFPLLATVFRAALGGPDFALWLAGPTGSQKSELAALAQQHYGAGMSRNRLPGNWSSTDNALEGLAFTVKDAILVVDDFAPSTSRNDADRQHRTAERLIRGQGNHAGRQRMRADGTLRPPKPPRGLILATGEDVPRGHSIAARLCVIDMQRGSVNLPRLSECQRDAAEGLYAAAMAGFTSWLAPQYAEVMAQLDAERIDLRNRFVGKYPHARTPDTIANLLIGLRYVLRFATCIHAIDDRQREALWLRGQAAFIAIAEQQGEHQRSVDPVARFPEMIAAIVSSGRGHIAGGDGKEPGIPPSPESWGWEGREFRSGSDETSVTYHARGSKIGWVEGEEVYLDPDSTFAALSELARDQGQGYPVTQQTLYKRLKEGRLLLRTEDGRTVYPVTLEGVRRRVLILSAPSLFGKVVHPVHPGRTPADGADTVPDSCTGFREDEGESVRKTGTETPEKRTRVPDVPDVQESGAVGRTRLKSDDRPHEWRGDP